MPANFEVSQRTPFADANFARCWNGNLAQACVQVKGVTEDQLRTAAIYKGRSRFSPIRFGWNQLRDPDWSCYSNGLQRTTTHRRRLRHPPRRTTFFIRRRVAVGKRKRDIGKGVGHSSRNRTAFRSVAKDIAPGSVSNR